MDTLNKEWDACFNLALEAVQAGSFGIGAVIINGLGETISRGRNQLYDSNTSCNIVKNSTVSHAELNAIAGIPEVHRDDKNLTLYATVEPCPMCMGAIAMSNIKKVIIASRDPWTGSTRLLDEDSYLNRKGISVNFETGLVEELFFLLHLYYIRKKMKDKHINVEHPALQAFRSCYATYYYHSNVLFEDEEFIFALINGDKSQIIQKVQVLRLAKDDRT